MMITEIFRKLDFRRNVRLEHVELVYESESALLVEVEDESAWLSKSNVTIKESNGTVVLELPRWLFNMKFSSVRIQH